MSLTQYPRIIAHRCGGALAPENSLSGLRLAAQLGCRAVEFDVMLSRDQVPLLFHDATLERTTNGQGALAAQDWAQLAQLDIACHFGRRISGFCAERMATLEEALRLCDALGLWANVEIKIHPPQDAVLARRTAQRVAEVLQRVGWNEQSGVVSSFAESALATLRELSLPVATAWLVDEIPLDWRQCLSQLNAMALHCTASEGNRQRLNKETASDWALAAFTVNARAEAERWFASGVAAVFTDRPDLWSSAEM